MEQEHFESQYPAQTYQREIEQMLGFLKDGKSCQLIGLPGTGKGTLLSLLVHNKNVQEAHLGDLREKVHFVYADFSEIRKKDLFDAMKFLFLSLTESLRERGMIEERLMVNDIFKESLSFNDELVLFQGLKEAVDYLAHDRKLMLIFLFDRFEEYVPTVNSEFFSNLRILRNKAKYQFQVVFSLNRALEFVLEPTLLADYYEFVAGNLVYMQLYEKTGVAFRTASIEKVTGKKLPPNLLEGIVHVTGGHAKLTKLAIETYLANEEVTEQDITKFLLQRRSFQGAILEIWLSLSPAEQSDILQEHFDDKEVDTYLENVGLIKDKKIQIEILSRFVKTQSAQLQIDEEKITYDEHTNTIKKGRIVLSDQLTASEFRLLRYLLQNQDRVVEREEIISIVWQEVKTTAGITDQAVDQLIFRLRRKIEEDANNPKHLLTVKGRGFRFAG